MTSLAPIQMSSALRWFAPPTFQCPDLSRRARAVWMMSWPFLGVITLLLGVAVAVEPETLLRRLTTVSAVASAEGTDFHGKPTCISRLGLAPDVYDALAGRAAAVIHCAASVRFDLPLEQADRMEFVRGAQSTLYGTDAMTSVVQSAGI